MAIYKLIANGSFGPEEIKVMTEAYEGAGLAEIPRRHAICHVGDRASY